MRGNRWQKFTLGIAYLIVAGGLCAYGLHLKSSNAFELGTLCVGLATGVGVVIYGNVKEHQAYAASQQAAKPDGGD